MYTFKIPHAKDGIWVKYPKFCSDIPGTNTCGIQRCESLSASSISMVSKPLRLQDIVFLAPQSQWNPVLPNRIARYRFNRYDKLHSGN